MSIRILLSIALAQCMFAVSGGSALADPASRVADNRPAESKPKCKNVDHASKPRAHRVRRDRRLERSLRLAMRSKGTDGGRRGYRGVRLALADDQADEQGALRRRSRPRTDRARFARRDRAPVDREAFADEVERVQAFLKEHFPERLRELKAFRAENPEGFRRRLAQIVPRMRRMMSMLERNPEAGKLMIHQEQLEMEIHKRVEMYFETTDSAKLRDLRREIRRLVEEKFDVRLKLRDQEVQRLERRLDAVKKQLERDVDQRDERIRQIVEELGIFDDD